MTMQARTDKENRFRKVAAWIILVWSLAVFILWVWASVKSIPAGGGLADIPAGLGIIVAALVAGAGLDRTVSYFERKNS